MSRSIAVAYSMKKKEKSKKLADGGPVVEDTPKQAGSGPSKQLDFDPSEVPVNTIDMSVDDGPISKDTASNFAKSTGFYADGGEVTCPHCEQSFSHKGVEANEKGPGAEEQSSDFDVVGRAMQKRKKK